jgi:hypothetical protein
MSQRTRTATHPQPLKLSADLLGVMPLVTLTAACGSGPLIHVEKMPHDNDRPPGPPGRSGRGGIKRYPGQGLVTADAGSGLGLPRAALRVR